MWSWQEGPVDRVQPHLVLRHDDHPEPVAVVGPPESEVFPVQFLVDLDAEALADVVAATRRELDYYLVEKGEWNPWGYAIYHTSTVSNLYSKVHWTYVEREQTGAEG